MSAFREVFPFHPTLTEDFSILRAHGHVIESRTQCGAEYEAGIVASIIRSEVHREMSRIRRQLRKYNLDPDISWLA